MTSYWYEHAVTGKRAEMSERFAKVFGDNLIKVDGPVAAPAQEETPRPSKKNKSSSETSTVEVTDNTDSSKEGNE